MEQKEVTGQWTSSQTVNTSSLQPALTEGLQVAFWEVPANPHKLFYESWSSHRTAFIT